MHLSLSYDLILCHSFSFLEFEGVPSSIMGLGGKESLVLYALGYRCNHCLIM